MKIESVEPAVVGWPLNNGRAAWIETDVFGRPVVEVNDVRYVRVIMARMCAQRQALKDMYRALQNQGENYSI